MAMREHSGILRHLISSDFRYLNDLADVIPIRIRNETRRRAEDSAVARQGEVDNVSVLMRIGIRKTSEAWAYLASKSDAYAVVVHQISGFRLSPE